MENLPMTSNEFEDSTKKTHLSPYLLLIYA